MTPNKCDTANYSLKLQIANIIVDFSHKLIFCKISLTNDAGEDRKISSMKEGNKGNPTNPIFAQFEPTLRKPSLIDLN